MKQQLVFLAAMLGFTYAVFSPHAETNAVPAPSSTAAKPGGSAFYEDAMVLDRDSGGQFHISGQVDGQETEFLVDTGADMVAITVEEAERLGIAVDPASFTALTQTASGIGQGAMVSVDRLEVAGKEFRDVDVAVLEGLPVNLLGQSILRQLGQVALEGDRMVIRQ